MLTPALLVFIAAADADGESTRAMVDAVSRVLGADALVLVERYDRPLARGALARAAFARGAAAAARLDWTDRSRTRAAIEVYLVEREQTVSRVLDFEPFDRPVERARSVGLVIASLVLAGAASPPAELPRPPPRMRPDVAGEAATTHRAVGPWSLEGFADAGLAIGGAGAGLGGGLAGRRHGPGAWGIRLGAHARGGSVPEAQASSLTAGLSAGAFRRLRGTGLSASGWEVGLRAELLLLYEALTHFSTDDPEPVRRGRFLPGAAALVEGQWRISPSAGMHLGVGLESAFGVTRVLVRGVEVRTVSPVRGVLEAGLRVRF